jgi:Fur family transcriptional regulator, ferric uptake regulator
VSAASRQEPGQTEWSAHARAVLKRAGFSRGGARDAVIGFLAGEECATSAQEIYAALHRDGPKVGMASVYRALETLQSHGLVQRLDVGHAEALYEPVKPGGEHHHHVVCDECDRIVPFEDPALERAITQLSRRVEFEIGGHDVVLHGRCEECRGAPTGRGASSSG